MLLSDGSVTRHLQLLTDLPVQVVSPAVFAAAVSHKTKLHAQHRHCLYARAHAIHRNAMHAAWLATGWNAKCASTLRHS